MKKLSTLRTLVEQQQYYDLQQKCEEILNHDISAEILPLYTLSQAQLGDIPAAQQSLLKAEAAIGQLDTEARIDLGAAYIVLFELDKAIQCLQACLIELPDHAVALARLGLCYMTQGDIEQACHFFEKSLNIESHRLAVLINLISLQLQQDQHDKTYHLLEYAFRVLIRQQDMLDKSIYQQHKNRLQTLQCQYWVITEAFSQAENWLAGLKQEKDEDDYTLWLSVYATKLAENDQHEQAEDALINGLKHYPQNHHLILQRSELALLQGRTQQAIHLIELAIKKDPDNPGLWIKLSNTCVSFYEERAKKAAEKAIQLSDSLVVSDEYPIERITALKQQAKNSLALVISSLQKYAEAETLFKQLLTENPHFIPALKGLGQQYLQRGKIDESVELFERIKLIEPVSGYTALINARQFPEDIKTLEKLDKAARIPSLEGRVRSGILFQLAAAYEKHQDYDKAFAYATEANNLSKRFLHYDTKAHRQSCARIRYAFSQSLYAHRKDYGISTNLPVFVLGMPRSGTTLVEQIIASHSQIFGAGELGIIPSRIQGLNRWERHVGSGRAYPDCVDDLTPNAVEKIANDILKELQEYAPDAKHIVDKLPHNFENIGLIKFLFPQAKIISVRRDPRDIAISNYFTDYQAKHGGMGFAYDLTSIGEQLADHNLLMHHWQQLFPGEILEINYEDVVENTEASAKNLLEYIGVNWEPQVLHFNQLDRPIKTASVWQVRQPIYKTSKAKWMRYKNHLAPLLNGTNARIEWEPIEMISLPEPGFQTIGADLFKQGDNDGAELNCKKMLYHNPDHGAANYLVGLVYCHKGYVSEGIEYLEKALKKCPWQQEWKAALIQAYRVTGQNDKVNQLSTLNPNQTKNDAKQFISYTDS